MADSESGGTIQSKDAALAKANSFLAVSLHRLLAEEKDNVFFSPFSISTAMAMLVCGAKGDTKSELKIALGHEYAGLQDATSAFRDQMSIFLKGSDNYTLNCANAMLTSKDLKVTEEYKSIISKNFDANLMEVDFLRECQKAVNTINAWVKGKTNNMIPKFINTINPSTVAVLLNAVYFKGDWMRKFHKSATYSQKFYNEGSKSSSKKIKMMHLKEKFRFTETDTHKILELPYCGDELAMLILLPNKMNGLEELESSLTPTFIEDTKMQLTKIKVTVALPRFRLEYSKSLIDCFMKLGVNIVFSPASDLGVISDCGGLVVSEIFHKAVLEVNEEGSEAAAATMVAMSRCAMLEEPEFIADHPFLFVIYDKRNDLILFMGRIIQL